MSDDKKDILLEYEEFTKHALLDKGEDDPEVTEFIKRVLGPELHAWGERGRKNGYWGEDEYDESEEETNEL